MPDRLVELFQRVAEKVADIDRAFTSVLPRGEGKISTLDTAQQRAALEKLRADWSELLGLVGQQKAMLGDIAQRTRELSSLSAYLQTHYERENARLARELHDELGGILTPAKMDLAWLEARLAGDPQYVERMARLSALIDQGIDLKRRIIEDLHPSLLDHLGLASAVQWYAEETCRAAKIECRLEVSPRLERLSPDVEIALYRVVQESLTNAVRHAKARRVDIVIERDKKGLRIEVRDDGIGIADLESARNLSHGLAGMSQRMRAIEGTFDVHSRKGGGTRVQIFVPIAG